MTEPYAWYGSPCPSCGADTWETWDRPVRDDGTAGEWLLRSRPPVTPCTVPVALCTYGTARSPRSSGAG